MNDERGYDWNRIGLLLMVAEKLSLYPKLKNLTSAVNAELDAIANPPSEEEGEAEPVEEQVGDPGAPPAPSSSTDGNEPDEQPKEKTHERRA